MPIEYKILSIMVILSIFMVFTNHMNFYSLFLLHSKTSKNDREDQNKKPKEVVMQEDINLRRIRQRSMLCFFSRIGVKISFVVISTCAFLYFTLKNDSVQSFESLKRYEGIVNGYTPSSRRYGRGRLVIILNEGEGIKNIACYLPKDHPEHVLGRKITIFTTSINAMHFPWNMLEATYWVQWDGELIGIDDFEKFKEREKQLIQTLQLWLGIAIFFFLALIYPSC